MSGPFITLLGDAWVAGKRDAMGLAMALSSSLYQQTGQPAIIHDMSGPGGLQAAQRKVSDIEDSDVIILALGTEDAAKNMPPEVWIPAFVSLVGLLQRRAPVLIVPPQPLGQGNPVPGYGRTAKRWARRVPAMAIDAVIEQLDTEHPNEILACTNMNLELSRADDVWLKPAGVRHLADYLTGFLLTSILKPKP